VTDEELKASLSAAEVLRRYKDEDLPAFAEVELKDVNQIGNFDERPLHVACSRGRLDEVLALLAAGAEIDAKGELANTPLHEAVAQDHVDIVRALLAHGASASIRNSFGETAVEIARRSNRLAIVGLLQNSSLPEC
jgi:ankyrin repeat protein